MPEEGGGWVSSVNRLSWHAKCLLPGETVADPHITVPRGVARYAPGSEAAHLEPSYA